MTIESVGYGSTGIFAPFQGKKVVLGAGGQLLEITDRDLELGTVHMDYDPATPPIERPNEDLVLRPGVYRIKDVEKRAYESQARNFPKGGIGDGGVRG